MSDFGFFGIFGFTSGLVLSYLLVHARSTFWPIDRPNERSLHAIPVRRVGGLAIIVPVLVGLVIAGPLIGWPSGLPVLAPLGIGLILIFGISLRDDFHPVPVQVRLGIQLLAVVPLLLNGWMIRTLPIPGLGFALPDPVAIALTLLWVVWMSNLYNFMDGLDGLAAGMAVIGFGTFALIGIMRGHALFAGVAGLVAASALGFLVLNFPPARIFMGDGGSVSLGYLAAALTLWAGWDRIFPLGVGVLAFSPFIVDASFTLLRRLVEKMPLWKAHRGHAYQRLVQAGFSRRRVVLLGYLYMAGGAICAMAAALAPRSPAAWALGSVWVLWLGVSIAIAHTRTAS